MLCGEEENAESSRDISQNQCKGDTTPPTSYSPSLESVYKEAMKAKEDSSKRKQKESSEPKLASVGEKGTQHDPNSVQAQELTHAVEYFITLNIIIIIALCHSKTAGLPEDSEQAQSSLQNLRKYFTEHEKSRFFLVKETVAISTSTISVC